MIVLFFVFLGILVIYFWYNLDANFDLIRDHVKLYEWMYVNESTHWESNYLYLLSPMY